MRAILVLLLLAVAAPAAEARSFSVPARVADVIEHHGTGAVALADGRVLWIELRGTRAMIVAAGEDAVPRDVAALGPARGETRYHRLVASGNLALLQRLVCRRQCTRDDELGEVLRVDLATGATTRFDPCPSEKAGGYLPVLMLRGSVLGTGCGSGDRVQDLADGASGRISGRLMAAAGRFAAWIDDRTGRETLFVQDWRTGAVISRVDEASGEPVEDVALDADGTLAWVRREAVHRLPPGAATATQLPGAQEVKLAGGVLATREHSLGAFNRFVAGGRVVDGQNGGFGWDFDGGRLAWVAQPCAQTVVQVWDLATEPPAPANPRCATARVGTVRLVGDELRIRLTCPPDAPPRGCAGFVSARLFAGSRKRAESRHPEPYLLKPGATSVVDLDVEGATARLVARVRVNDTTTRRRVRG